VDGTKDSATIENLAAPGTTYSYRVTPYNEYGLAGETSAAATFASSNEPFTLVASDVRSATYSAGTSGWKIAADGTAEFNGGGFSVTSIDIGGNDASSFHVNTEGDMWLGASASASAPFRVTKAGVLTALSGTFSGNLNGGTIDIGSGATSFHVDASGQMWAGAAAYASGKFRVSAGGDLFANSVSFNVGSFGGIDFASNALSHAGGLGNTLLGDTGSDNGNKSGVRANGSTGYSFVVGDNIASLNSSGQGQYMSPLGLMNNGYSFGPGPFYNYIIWDCAPDGTLYYAVNNAGVGTIGPTGLGYGVVSDIYTYYAFNGYVSSDRRLKANIAEPEDYWVEKLLNDVKIWQFDKISPIDPSDMHLYGKHIGVIADEIKDVFPQFETSHMLLDPDGEDADKTRSVNYVGLVPIIVLALKKFDARLAEIEARLGI
jgi:hypothetical protein